MLHPKQYIADLSEICYQSGIKYAVISPGSRNAPLIEAFYSRYKDCCISIVDERSAGYFALGLARFLRSPVALVCTSGTAVLNYSPALAEAYYARIPLLAITADRPAEWIDQQDNQTIRQPDVYKNFILKSFHLPEVVDTPDALSLVQHMIWQAIGYTQFPYRGPVHLNVPLHEPLYETLPSVSGNIKAASQDTGKKEVLIPSSLLLQWKTAQKVLIIHGLDYPDSGIAEPLRSLAKDPGVLIIAENISNVHGEGMVANPELLLAHTDNKKLDTPDLVLYSGGQIVSKRLKQYLRGIKKLNVWRIGLDNYKMDTFRQHNTNMECGANIVYSQLTSIDSERKSDGYKANWLKANDQALNIREQVLKKSPFSDLIVFKTLLDALPSGVNLELGNSTPIRYAQFFNTTNGLKYFCNRGISGIDGCLSSAVGTAFASTNLTVTIVGDLSFIYDSNALWNKRLPANLRIVVMNNHGGGIFSLLDGPDSKASFEEYVEAFHPVDIQKLAEAFNLDYFCISEQDSLTAVMPIFLKDSGKAKVMEVRTERRDNIKAYNLITGRFASDNN